MTVAATLAQAIAAARAGRHDEARATLLKVLEADERNESAWLWLSGVVSTPAERRVCLENVLAINPANEHARRGLALLDSQPAPSGASTVRLTPPAAPAAPAVAAAPAPVTPAPVATPAAPIAPAAAPTAAPVAPAAAPVTPAAPAAAPAPAPAPQTPALWLPAPPATGATISLNPDALEGTPMAMPAIRIEDMELEEPCPYCGAVTRLSERSCRSCRKSLMVRRQPRDKRSVALTILAGLWALSTLGGLIGSVLLIIPIVILTTQAASLGLELPIIPLVSAIAAALVGVAFCGSTTLGLFRRQRWAYITNWVTLILGLLMTVAWVVLAGMVGAAALSLPELSSQRAEPLAAAGSLGGAMLCNLVIYAGYIALSVMSHRDFYGEKARLTIEGISTGGEPYNAGILYRNRGMWYMAAHAWERAVQESPRDATARRALGLAYAQLKRYDEARITLREAQALTPDDPQLVEDLALVERLAAQNRRKAAPATGARLP